MLFSSTGKAETLGLDAGRDSKPMPAFHMIQGLCGLRLAREPTPLQAVFTLAPGQHVSKGHSVEWVLTVLLALGRWLVTQSGGDEAW